MLAQCRCCSAVASLSRLRRRQRWKMRRTACPSQKDTALSHLPTAASAIALHTYALLTDSR